MTALVDSEYAYLRASRKNEDNLISRVTGYWFVGNFPSKRGLLCRETPTTSAISRRVKVTIAINDLVNKQWKLMGSSRHNDE